MGSHTVAMVTWGHYCNFSLDTCQHLVINSSFFDCNKLFEMVTLKTYQQNYRDTNIPQWKKYPFSVVFLGSHREVCESTVSSPEGSCPIHQMVFAIFKCSGWLLLLYHWQWMFFLGGGRTGDGSSNCSDWQRKWLLCKRVLKLD